MNFNVIWMRAKSFFPFFFFFFSVIIFNQWYFILLGNIFKLPYFHIKFFSQGCHFSANRRISAFLLWAANCIISLFFSEKISSFLLANNQWSNVASECSNIQSFSIHNINISIHTNLILFYSTIHKELQITFIFYKRVHKFMY